MNSYPIILAHGIARFDFLVQRLAKDFGALGVGLGLADNELHYFKNIARHLRNNGFAVYQSSVSFAAGVARRAADLKREVETALNLFPGNAKVHIIGHSMGGLDARYMLAHLGMAEKVASLTTIGTPHNGTSFADWGMANAGHHLLDIMRGIVDLGGLADLTTVACRKFNERAEALEAANEVVYQTYASSDKKINVFAPLQPSWQIIYDAEGENDGLVPRTSQGWQSELTGADGARKTIRQHAFPIAADHLNQIGWWDMNQLWSADNFSLNINPFQSAQTYERRIREVYLEIARSVQALE